MVSETYDRTLWIRGIGYFIHHMTVFKVKGLKLKSIAKKAENKKQQQQDIEDPLEF